MRRVALAVVSTVTGLVMLLSFKTHTAATTLAAPRAATTTTSQTATTSGTTSGTTTGTRTITGSAVDTRWGPVQVQITVTNGKVTAAQAVVFPSGNPRDQEINSYAIPVLNSEAVQAGSAQIDSVSGATVTSGGYISSLQSAIDKLHAR